MTNCCKNDFSQTEIMTSSSMTDNIFHDENLVKKIPQVKNSNQGIDYITSKECYQLLIRKLPKIIFTKKLCENLECKEILKLIKESINWILESKIEKNNLKMQKYILMIKNYTNFGTKKIIGEIEDINNNNLLIKEDEKFLLQSLSDWILLIELILFLNNSNDNNNYGTDFSCKNLCTAYDINLWSNKNIDDVIKKYCFDGCYYLLQIKIKYKQENRSFNKFLQTSYNSKVNIEIKNEFKKIFSLLEDFVNEISDKN